MLTTALVDNGYGAAYNASHVQVTPTIEPFYAELGRRIRSARERIRPRLTQEQLGKRLDPPMTRAGIANIEAGKQRVLAHTLCQLSSALNVSATDILPTTDVRASSPSASLEAEFKEKLRLPGKKIKRLVAHIESNPEEKR